jgi:alpha-D-ribose 1-methylphosphonate 5-triphosphate synthase subunit PhnL
MKQKQFFGLFYNQYEKRNGRCNKRIEKDDNVDVFRKTIRKILDIRKKIQGPVSQKVLGNQQTYEPPVSMQRVKFRKVIDTGQYKPTTNENGL